METQLLQEIVIELKNIKKSVSELEEIKKSVSELEEIKKDLKDLKKSVNNLETDVSEIKYVINKGVFVDIKNLEKRIEALEQKVV